MGVWSSQTDEVRHVVIHTGVRYWCCLELVNIMFDITLYLQGMFRSSIKCNSCGKCSVTFEPFMYLSLPIPPGQGSASLEVRISLYTSQDTRVYHTHTCTPTNTHTGLRKTIHQGRDCGMVSTMSCTCTNCCRNASLWSNMYVNRPYIDMPFQQFECQGFTWCIHMNDLLPLMSQSCCVCMGAQSCAVMIY